ncbi:SET domain-containing protein [Mycena indigotica]|uniref:SET domain-containing protein n=1 Tax=Mycena indigotica TaxID=2126181 RepID=A0A8H6SGQ6_9AGAR|nr:SET domain-containing protein [Mycena indigotica]KAF7298643.1 SET domain-containing protein [Mycena indigotica]
MNSDSIKTLLAWCFSRKFWIDPRIRIVSGSHGVAVVSEDIEIPTETTLVHIPRQSVLSVKSSPISDLIPASPYGRAAQLSLALALSVEIANGETSAWHGYLQSLPRDLPGLFWVGGAGDFDMELLNGTEAAKLLVNLVEEVDEYYDEIAASVFSQLPLSPPSLSEFRFAYGLVSSRAFLVDSYHGLAMVPIADAFNHIQDNHIHLESDFDVCPECGSLNRCLHDDHNDSIDEEAQRNEDDFYEMVSNRTIGPNEEIFNTYGDSLSNAQLFVQYGFILDVNENDCLTWTATDLAQFVDCGRIETIMPSLSILPWELIEESEMVYRDARFSLNDDGSISHSLWLVFAFQVIIPTTPINGLVPRLENLFQRQLALERSITEGTPLSHDDEDDAILKLAELLASLCRARYERLSAGNKSNEELGDLLDTFSEGSPTRMAVSLVLTERSLLDSCMASWEALTLVSPTSHNY